MNKTNTFASITMRQILLDFLMLAFAVAIVLVIYGPQMTLQEAVQMLAFCAMFALVFYLSNCREYVYNITLFQYMDRMLKRYTKSFLISGMAVLVLIVCGEKDTYLEQAYYVFLIVAYVLMMLKVIISRVVVQRWKGIAGPRTVFVGNKDMFNRFQYFLEKTSIRMEFLGYVALTKQDLENAEAGTYLGSLEDLEELVRVYNLDQVYMIQKREISPDYLQDYVDVCIDMGVTVRLIQDIYKRRRANSYVSAVGNYPIITYHTISLNPFEQFWKRIMDILGGLAGVILFSPIMLVAAIAIKLDSQGPVVFKQTRVGQNGRNFVIYKFRSMYIDAEERKKELMEKNEMEGGVMFKMKDDPRITKVGKVIRKLSIDELPQFFNVLNGTMSLVGTRPPTLDEVEKYKRTQWRRISIKPGITGMWQVNGRSTVHSFEEVVEMDVEYIDNWSLFLDIKIILKTVLVLLNHKGAY